jgi:hypothetical protein
MDPSEDPQGATSMGGVDTTILQANGLRYKMPQSLSTTVNRTFKKQYAQRQQYEPASTIVFDINTGADYVDPKNVMLTFNLQVVATATPGVGDEYNFGTGSACNLIQEIRILSKNGTELQRTQAANVLSKIMIDYNYSEEGQKMLEMAGYALPNTAAVGASTRFVIPMHLLEGFFRPIDSAMKIPAGLSSGLRIELTLAPSNIALVNPLSDTGRILRYTVLSPEMLMMCHNLTDPTQAALMSVSASSGLEYAFRSYFHTPLQTESQSVNEQVKKSVSQLTRVFTGIYGTTQYQDEEQDSFASVNSASLQNYQYRVGANYYPKETVQTDVEAWYVTESSLDKMRDLKTFPSNVALADYQTGGKFLIGAAIETDSRLNLTGCPINNSNVLELRTLLTAAPVGGRNIDIFIEFISVARTFINNTTLKI